MPLLIETSRKIGEEMGRSPQTILRLIKYHGFPACKMPNGNWATTKDLINLWIMNRREEQDRTGKVNNVRVETTPK